MRKHLHEILFLIFVALAFFAGACWSSHCDDKSYLDPAWPPKPDELRGPSPEQFVLSRGESIDASFDY